MLGIDLIAECTQFEAPPGARKSLVLSVNSSMISSGCFPCLIISGGNLSPAEAASSGACL